MDIHGQLLRYGVVGIVSNGALYLGYLALTSLGVGHKTAMTGLYAAGVLGTFFFNRRWTFLHQGGIAESFLRYVTTFLLGYILNLSGLAFFVDRLCYPHQIVQALLVFVVAAFLFVMQRFWVFRGGADEALGDTMG